MATTVQIELTVDEKGAVTGIRNFGTATQQATAVVTKLGEQLTTTERTAVQSLGQTTNAARGTTSAFQKLAEATMELNYVQGRNREILTALRKGEVSASQATLDLAESMQEQTAAATALAAAKAELSQQDARLSSRQSYGVARIGASALTGSFSGMGMGLA